MPTTANPIRFPAEWETQSGVMLTWPHAQSDWRAKLGEIESVYIAMCKAISAHETCIVLCLDEAHKNHIAELLRAHGVSLDHCRLIICPTNDTWCRDYGPITTLVDNKPLLNNFIFDAWGGKYQSLLDNAVTDCLQQQGLFATDIMPRELVLEGGSIEPDGAGTLLTTSHCLLKRHPDKSKAAVEAHLQSMLGVKRMLWLDAGSLGGDDTDSHIDNLARFANAETILYAACTDKAHPDYAALQEMQSQLKTFTRTDGSDYQLLPLYLPDPVYDKGQALPASYVNFLVINDAVLVPQFGQESDAAALAIFRQTFPTREIIGISSTALIKQFGGIHCATMHLPQGTLNQEPDNT